MNFRWPGSDTLHSSAPVPWPLCRFSSCTCCSAAWRCIPHQPPSPSHTFRPRHWQRSGDVELHALHQVPANPWCHQQHEVAADGNEGESCLCLQLMTSGLVGCFFVLFCGLVPVLRVWQGFVMLLLLCICIVQLSAVVWLASETESGLLVLEKKQLTGTCAMWVSLFVLVMSSTRELQLTELWPLDVMSQDVLLVQHVPVCENLKAFPSCYRLPHWMRVRLDTPA